MGIHAAAIPRLEEMVEETISRMRRYAQPGKYLRDIARGVAREAGFPEEDIEWISREVNARISSRSGRSQKGKKRGPRRRRSKAVTPNKTPTLEDLERLWAESDRHNPIYGVPGHQLKLAV